MKLNDIKIKNNAVKSALLLTAFALVSCNSEKQESAVEGKVKKGWKSIEKQPKKRSDTG